MSVTNTTVKFTVAGSSSGAFTTDFVGVETSDVVINKIVAATGVRTLLISGVDYTIAKTTPSNHTSTFRITPAATIPAGTTWHIVRSTPIVQETTYQPGGRLASTTLSNDLDLAAVQSQELDFFRKRSVRVKASDTTGATDSDTAMELPDKADRANKLMSFDANGEVTATAVSTISPGSVSVGDAGQTLLPLADNPAWRAALDVPYDKGDVENFQAGTSGDKPGTAAFGKGFYYETNTRDLYYSDGNGSNPWVLLSNLTNALNVPAPGGGGDAAKTLKVNAAGTGYEFDIPRFEATPNLTGASGDVSKLVRVASGGSTYELSEIDQDITVGAITAATNVATGEGGGPVKQGNIDIGPFRIRFDHVLANTQTEVEIDVSDHFSVVWFVVGGTGIREDNDPTGGQSRAEWCYVSSTTGLKMYSQNDYMAYLAIGLKPT
tara:strand:+ start:4297 stop:5604 length:1308 start_codon:yes stop_codon:yes gene_type:complete